MLVTRNNKLQCAQSMPSGCGVLGTFSTRQSQTLWAQAHCFCSGRRRCWARSGCPFIYLVGPVPGSLGLAADRNSDRLLLPPCLHKDSGTSGLPGRAAALLSVAGLPSLAPRSVLVGSSRLEKDFSTWLTVSSQKQNRMNTCFCWPQWLDICIFKQ